MTQRGFTLLEVLIAMALFSLLGLACYQLLERVTHSEKRIALHEQQLRQLQRALGLFEQDLAQAIAYPLSDDPSRRQALIGRADGLRLVRGGWSNPLQQRRGEVLEIRHDWSDGQWLREYRGQPGRELENSESHAQRLLDGVTLKRLRYIDHEGRSYGGWPVGSSPLSLPQALELELDVPGYPDIRRVVLLPGYPGADDA
ncbi:type II secretion system minor pseudopilin GspJ [Pseudomonas sp. Q1-7]|uniref:type II secretion system minor pseudopilin GspJ n=1 Tax=Pseudomonas sp. Q1-7 TaxID=3020843 RepID=UPI0022FFE97E|nr:type II secretion system minor pseudopilin GspJ [Pseudomonas sp. Q1-7]